MKFFLCLVGTFFCLAPAMAQMADIRLPTEGEALFPGQDFIAQITRTGSPISCIEVGIALAMASCSNGICPDPSKELGNVLYNGPFTPMDGGLDGQYQNFTLEVPQHMDTGPAVFTLTHLCLLGAGPVPLLEYRNANVTIDGY